MSAANMFYGQKKPVNTADILSRSATASPASIPDSQRPLHPQSAFAAPPVLGAPPGSMPGGGHGGSIPSINVTNPDPTTTWNGRDGMSNMSSYGGGIPGTRPQIQKQKSTPRPGAILTGKQEHCMPSCPSGNFESTTNFGIQTSSANCSANKRNTKSLNSTLPLRFAALALHSDQTLARYLLKTPNYPYSATSSSNMYATFRSLIKRARRSFGRTGCKFSWSLLLRNKFRVPKIDWRRQRGRNWRRRQKRLWNS